MDIVKLAIRNARLSLSVLFFLVVARAVAYQSIPKEAEPDVAIPIIYVSLIYQGISPEDSDLRLQKRDRDHSSKVGNKNVNRESSDQRISSPSRER